MSSSVGDCRLDSAYVKHKLLLCDSCAYLERHKAMSIKDLRRKIFFKDTVKIPDVSVQFLT